MVAPLQHVQPGDVISANFTNNLIDALLDLQSRVGKLEGTPSSSGNAVAITGLAPAGPLRVGDDVEILGRNFGFSIGVQRVFFDSSRVTVYRTGSSDTALYVQVPDVPNVSEVGTPVTLTVANQSTTDTRQVTLQPARQQQQGNIFLAYQGVNPTTIQPGGPTPQWNYRLESQALLPVSVTINPNIAGGLTAVPAVFNVSAGNTRVTDPILLNPKQTIELAIEYPIPSGTLSGTTFTLTVAATADGVTGAQDGPRSFTIGTPADQVDNSIVPSINLADPRTALTGTTIHVAQGNLATVQLKVEFTSSAVPMTPYDLSVAVTPGSNWNGQISQSIQYATPAFYTLSTLPDTKFPAFDVSPQAGASASAQLVFTIQRRGATSKQTVPFTLQLG